MSDPASTTPSATAVAASSILEAVLNKTPASARRAGALVAAIVMPYLNELSRAKLGVGVDGNTLIAIEGVIGVYITQSFLNTVHERSSDTKVAVAQVAAATPAAPDAAPGAP